MSDVTAATSPEITPVWQAWVAENLLRGVPPRQVVATMTTHGFDEPAAHDAVMTAVQHPYVVAGIKLGVGAGGGAPLSGGGGSARAEKYAWWMETQRRAARLSRDHGTVPRVTRPSTDEFLERFYAANRPCVIEGAIDDWPALTAWTPDYLKAACGDQIVEVQGGRNTGGAYLDLDRKIPFAEFVDIVEAGEQTNDWYMTANNDPGNGDALAALWDDVRLPDLLTKDRGPIGRAFVWYGPGGTLSPTHHDLTNNLMAQVIGRKRVRLVAPQESHAMYNTHARRSPVDLESPDLAAHPDAADLSILDVTIAPGDLLFIPVGWWHSVRALDVSFTFTFNNFIYDDNDAYTYWSSDRDLD